MYTPQLGIETWMYKKITDWNMYMKLYNNVSDLNMPWYMRVYNNVTDWNIT